MQRRPPQQPPHSVRTISSIDLGSLVPEHSHLDYKLMCNAFNNDSDSNAELVKDVCAMANNGNSVSRLVIGISDDLASFRNFANEKFTAERLQDLVANGVVSPEYGTTRIFRVFESVDLS